MRFCSALIAATLSIALAACGDETGDDNGNPIEAVSCAQETRAEAYVAGMEKVGTNGIKVALLESTPTPPSKGNNEWRIQVMDSSDDPLSGLTIDVNPDMPDHGHGPGIFPGITEIDGASGEYMLAPVRLWMPGYWEIDIAVSDSAELSDSVKFKVCIEG